MTSYEKYILNELARLKEDNHELRIKLRNELGENLLNQDELERLRHVNIELSEKINRLGGAADE